MINTLNESSLHKALKTFYAVQFSAQEEAAVGRWICDLVSPQKGIIEIQTKNVGALKEKIAGLLEMGQSVTVVHPIIKTKIIETYGADGTLLSRRKSPKKESIYSELREFTGLAELLPQKKLAVLLPQIELAEKRVQTKEAEQSKNRRRRFKKAWQKTDKTLLTIGETIKLNGTDGWLSLLPKEILAQGEAFCAATVRDAFLKENDRAAAREANLLLWLLRKMGAIVRVQGPGRSYWHVIAAGGPERTSARAPSESRPRKATKPSSSPRR